MSTSADQYYIKALDQYPYSLEEAIENLGYALSHNDEHSGANYLMGKFYQEQMSDFSTAENYYLKALASNADDLNVCMAYVHLLIIIKEYDKAQNLIVYARKIKGVDLSKLYSFQALIFESQHNYDEALALFKEARLEAYNEECMNYLSGEIKRVKMKRKYVDKSKDKKVKSQKSQ